MTFLVRDSLRSLTLSFGASSYVKTVIVCAIKQRIAPSHSNMAKPPNICLQNFTHSGMVFGGDNAFGPSRAKTSAALASVKPYQEIFLQRSESIHSENLLSPDEFHIVERVLQLVLYDHPRESFAENETVIEKLTISNSRFRSSKLFSSSFLLGFGFFSLV